MCNLNRSTHLNAAASSMVVAVLAILVIGLPQFTAPAYAAPITSAKIKCGDVECGTMDINTYTEHKNDTLAGVLIEGTFTAAKPGTYHYMQSVLQTTERRWVDGTVLPVPYVDTPPGGYRGDPWDYLPYYDQGEFPAFHDRPSRLLTRADAGKVTFQWETWIVCVIAETLGEDARKGSDDSYKLAVLPMGFTWGFSIEKTGRGATKDDYTVAKLAFTWLAAPTAAFLNSWNTVYGVGRATDRFNIVQGDCKECLPTPEPATGVLLGMGILLVAVGRRRYWTLTSRVKMSEHGRA